MKKTRLAKVAVEAIENGPKWTPAQQNGRYVNAFRLQPVTVTDPREIKSVYRSIDRLCLK
jgi:protein TonB